MIHVLLIKDRAVRLEWLDRIKAAPHVATFVHGTDAIIGIISQFATLHEN
jgi:hypothetical protein